MNDPICGMTVEPESAPRAVRNGQTFYFCSENCRKRFEASPEKFIARKSEEPRPTDSDAKRRQSGRGRSWRDYIPLIVIIALTLLAACAKQISYAADWNWMSWMHDFMGFFLVIFSMFKLFNLEGFADGFQMYDLLAKPVRAYAYLYPFIELGLGLGYLAHWHPKVIYSATVIVMTFGALGVINALRKGLDLECACMGTVLRVPLSTVALSEDLGMATMAGLMLLVGLN